MTGLIACAHCGEPFTAKTKKRFYCSAKCAAAFHYYADRENKIQKAVARRRVRLKTDESYRKADNARRNKYRNAAPS